jgi:hypothetical protein
MLQDMLDKINRHRQGLDSTLVSHLWGLIWSSGEVDEPTALISKLSACQESLGVFLVALSLYVYMLTGNHRSLKPSFSLST